MVDSKSGFEHKKFTTAINCTVKRVISMIIMIFGFTSKLLALLLDIFGNISRNMRHRTPMLIRRSVIRRLFFPHPLWLFRILLNLVTMPIGDEKKWIHEITHSTWKGVWIVQSMQSLKQAEVAALNNDLVILYAHSGGFCYGHSKMSIETFQLIINHLRIKHHIRASILSLEYSLNPENVWPKACHEAMDAYRYLIDILGINPKKIILVGDSAGGNLMASILLKINNEQAQHLLPAGAGLLSPWLDLTASQFSGNDVVTSNHLAKYTSYYIPNYKNLDEEGRLSMIHNPLLSPFYGDFSGTCPIFLSYGEKELLRTSIEAFKSKLEKAGCDLTTLRGENTVHNWIISSWMAESMQIHENDCKTFINWMASLSKPVCVSNNK